jgi:hypothetical protein
MYATVDSQRFQRCRRAFPVPRRPRRTHLGQTEIQNLRVPLLGHKNIRRLDVPMDDALSVRRIQRLRHFNRQIQQTLQLHRLPVDLVFQRHAV